MSELAEKIYDYFTTNNRYTLSLDAVVKNSELDAIDELSNSGYITIKIRTIGYVIAEINV